MQRCLKKSSYMGVSKDASGTRTVRMVHFVVFLRVGPNCVYIAASWQFQSCASDLCGCGCTSVAYMAYLTISFSPHVPPFPHAKFKTSFNPIQVYKCGCIAWGVWASFRPIVPAYVPPCPCTSTGLAIEPGPADQHPSSGTRA